MTPNTSPIITFFLMKTSRPVGLIISIITFGVVPLRISPKDSSINKSLSHSPFTSGVQRMARVCPFTSPLILHFIVTLLYAGIEIGFIVLYFPTQSESSAFFLIRFTITLTFSLGTSQEI